MQEISEMVSRPLHLGAGGCQRFFLLAEACVPLRTARPLLKKTFMTSVDDFIGLGLSRNGLTNFLEKNHKSIGQKAA